MALTTISCRSAEEAAQLLSSQPRARLLGGGTLLMRAVNAGDDGFDTLLRIDDPSLRSIQRSGEHLLLGAQATMTDIMQHRDAEFLAEVARQVGGPAVRNMATVAGNLYAPSPYGDLATALLALDAQVLVAGQPPWQPLLSVLEARQIGTTPVISQVSVLVPRSPDAFRFLKISRVKPKGISVMSMAAHLPREGNRVGDARVAYGAMGPTPVRVTAVEAVLSGQTLDERTVEAAAGRACEGLDPPTDAIASAWYRGAVAPVHLRRLLSGQRSQRH